MAKISGVCAGESLVGEGNEVAHVDLLIGPRGRRHDRDGLACVDRRQGMGSPPSRVGRPEPYV